MPSQKRPADGDDALPGKNTGSGAGEKAKVVDVAAGAGDGGRGKRVKRNEKDYELPSTTIIRLKPSPHRKVHPARRGIPSNPLLAPSLDATDYIYLKVGDGIASSKNSQVIMVKFGDMVKVEGKRISEFKVTEGFPWYALKVIKYTRSDDKPDPLLREFTVSDLAFTRCVDAADFLVPVLCWAHAGYLDEKSAGRGESFVGEEAMRVLIEPLHIAFTVGLSTNLKYKLTDEEKKLLWQDGYHKIKRIHKDARLAHRDIKSHNAVIKSHLDVDGELVMDEPKSLLFIDMSESRDFEEDVQDLSPSGTLKMCSISTVLWWYKDWFENNGQYNERLYEAEERPDGSIRRSWLGRDIAEYLGHLKYGSPHKLLEEDDVWCWGSSLLYYLDKPYHLKYCYDETLFTEFKASFPEEGPCIDFEDAYKLLYKLAQRYSPVYDTRTYQFQVDENGKQISEGKVSEEWWELLALMLTRGDNRTHYSAIHDQAEVEADIGAAFKTLTTDGKASSLGSALKSPMKTASNLPGDGDPVSLSKSGSADTARSGIIGSAPSKRTGLTIQCTGNWNEATKTLAYDTEPTREQIEEATEGKTGCFAISKRFRCLLPHCKAPRKVGEKCTFKTFELLVQHLSPISEKRCHYFSVEGSFAQITLIKDGVVVLDIA